MGIKNALQIIKRRVKSSPELEHAYLEEKLNYQIACKIREYRKRKGLSQKKLALLIDSKQSVISRLENADYVGHSLSILKKIAIALEEPFEIFLQEEKKSDDRTLTFNIPPVVKSAISFNYLNSPQVIKRHYAR